MIPRMRTLDQAIEYIKDNDEHSAISKNALRQLIIKNQMPSVRVGKKYLVDLDAIEDYFRGKKQPYENTGISEDGTF